jgi:predicted RNase H-like HicB family nuclease
MTLQVIVHKAEEGGYWAEVPALPGCVTQAESLDELRKRAKESIEAYLGLDEEVEPPTDGEIWEIAV